MGEALAINPHLPNIGGPLGRSVAGSEGPSGPQ